MSIYNAFDTQIHKLSQAIERLKQVQYYPVLTGPKDPIDPIDGPHPQAVGDNQHKAQKAQSSLTPETFGIASVAVSPSQFNNQRNAVVAKLEAVRNQLQGMSSSLASEKTNLSNTIGQQNSQISNLANANSNRENTIENLEWDNRNRGETILYQQRDIDALTGEVSELNNQITSLSAARDQARDELNQANSQRDDAIAEKENMLSRKDELAQEIEQLNQKISELEAELATASSRLAEAEAVLETLKQEQAALEAQFQADLADKKAWFEQEKVNLEEQHTALVAELKAKAEALSSSAGEKLSLEDFIKQTNENLAQVQQNLRQINGSYLLGPVDMALKIIPDMSMGTNAISLPRLSELKSVGNDHLSTLKLQFFPDQQAPSVPDNGSPGDPAPAVPLMPDFTGQTSTFSTREANKLGLALKLLQQTVSEPGLAGRILRQQPLPEAPYPQGGTVSLWVGKYAPLTSPPASADAS